MINGKSTSISKGKKRLKGALRGNKLQVEIMAAIVKYCQGKASCAVPLSRLLKIVLKMEAGVEDPEAHLIGCLNEIKVIGKPLVVCNIEKKQAIITKDGMAYINKYFAGGRKKAKDTQPGRRNFGKK
jgi:hypothetical protein